MKTYIRRKINLGAATFRLVAWMALAYLILNHAMGFAISSNAHMSHTIASLVPHSFLCGNREIKYPYS